MQLSRTLDSTMKIQEPKFFDGMPENDRRIVIMRAFNWYNYFMSKKEFKKELIEYAKNVLSYDSKDIRLMKKAEDYLASNSSGSYVMMTKNGWVLSESEKKVITDNLDRLISAGKEKEKLLAIKQEENNNNNNVTPNPQQFMLDKYNNTIAQNLFDLESEWADNNFSATINTFNLIKQYELKGATLNHITDWATAKLSVYEEILSGKDEDLKEAYSHMSKSDVKNIIKTLKNIISDVDKSKQVQKVTRPTPAKQPKKPSVDKLIEYLQYQKEDKDLKIASVNPAKIIGAKRMVVLNTKYNYITEFISDQRDGLSVKRYSSYIENFSEEESRTFTLPKKLLSEGIDAALKQSKRQFNNFVNNVVKKDKHPDIARRINKNTIILKVE